MKAYELLGLEIQALLCTRCFLFVCLFVLVEQVVVFLFVVLPLSTLLFMFVICAYTVLDTRNSSD